MENNNKDAESEKVEINDEEIREANTEELKEKKKKKNSKTNNMLSSPEILDENEKSKVDSMRALVQKEDPSFQVSNYEPLFPQLALVDFLFYLFIFIFYVFHYLSCVTYSKLYTQKIYRH